MRNLDQDILDFLSELEFNVSDEALARQGYINLLKKLESIKRSIGNELYEYIKKEIEEYISEESKHSLGLTKIFENISGILPEM